MPKWEPLKKYPNIYRYKNKNDKKYKYGVRRTYQLPGQKRSEFTKSGLHSISDAKAVLDKFNADKVKPKDKSNMTLVECYEEMKKLKLNSGKWRKTTAHMSDKYVKNFVKKDFANTKISRAGYQDYINSLSKRGFSKAYIEDINGMFQTILNYAEYNDYIVKNKIQRIDIPHAKQAKSMTIEKENYEKWFKTAKEILNPYYYSPINFRRTAWRIIRS